MIQTSEASHYDMHEMKYLRAAYESQRMYMSHCTEFPNIRLERYSANEAMLLKKSK